jgi:hypothetical protein
MSMFFQRTLRLHITATTVRKVVERAFRAAEKHGVIMPQQRVAVHMSQGHSPTTANRYYVMNSRTERYVYDCRYLLNAVNNHCIRAFLFIMLMIVIMFIYNS